MKRNYLFIFTVLVAMIVFVPAKKIMAQSELVVEWQSGTGDVITDALRTAIESDVNRPADRVYKLKKGGFYWITETITNSGFPLRIVGETPGAGELDNPAVLQMVARGDGTVNGRMLTGGGDITLKNLYIMGNDNNGVQTYYQPIQVDASNSRFIIDNCIFERTNFALMAFTAANNDIFFTNCKFRNLIGQPSTQQWEGRGISIWADQDTVVVENCTFFNVGFTAYQLESGAATYFRFNHNTLVNVGRGMFAVPWFRSAYIANNLIVNGFWHGEGYGDVTSAGRDPRAWFSGMFGIGALPTKYGPEQGRRILFGHNATWRDPAFATFYADTIRPQWYINQVTKEDYLDVYENMVARDTVWLASKPNFVTYPSAIIPDMIQNITDLRAGTTPAHPYFYQLPADPTIPSWPIPENFTYTDANLMTMGSDQLPLGDLNWFPTQKAMFEANKDQYITNLEKEAGPTVTYNITGDAEAEAGTVGGTATVENYAGALPYFHMEGGGSITWKFNLAAPTTVELNVSTRSQDARRGQHIKINGTDILNYTGSGEYSWFDLDKVNWKVYNINKDTLASTNTGAALDLPAGENTIVISPSWGYQEFQYVEVKSGGAIIQTLNASNATVDIVTIVSPDPTVYVPSGFKSVNLGANGSVAWSFNIAQAGNYALSVVYQAPNGAQTGQLQSGNNNVSVAFAGEAGNNSAHTILTDVIPLGTGNQTMTLSGSNILVDKVQLVQKVVSGIKQLPGLPEGFALQQNYPNPFNPSTTINFNLAKESNVKLIVYNILGQKVATLINNTQMNAGTFSVDFNASHLSSGVYFYSLEADGFKLQKKMMLLK